MTPSDSPDRRGRAPRGLLDARVVDLHAHVVLERTLGAAGAHGPEIGTNPDGSPYYRVGERYRLNGVRYRGSPFMDPALRIRRMDEQGIDFQVLSPNPLTYFHFVGRDAAIAFCERHNDALADVVHDRPQRLGGLAALPVQDPEAAARELERAVRSLGLLGGAMGTDLPHPLHDASMDVLYDRAASLGVPLSIHPGPAGIDGPPGDPALRHFELDIVVGFGAQETLAVASLIFGGVLDRHPRLEVCVSHGGGATPIAWPRMARAAALRPWVAPALREPGAFERRLRRLWVDTHVMHPDAIRLLSDTYGADRLVHGTNFAGWDAPDAAAHGPVPAFLADNARRLLGVAAPDAPRAP